MAKAKDSHKDKAMDNHTAADEDTKLQSTTPTQASPAKKSPLNKPVTGKAAIRASGGTGNGSCRASVKR